MTGHLKSHVSLVSLIEPIDRAPRLEVHSLLFHRSTASIGDRMAYLICASQYLGPGHRESDHGVDLLVQTAEQRGHEQYDVSRPYLSALPAAEIGH
jgi:hypothetical protein